MSEEDSRLDSLFKAYRDACPDIEPRAQFMPELWQKIEARRGFWFVFQRNARAMVTGSAALCLLLLVLNFIGINASNSHVFATTYTDALMADHTAEVTDYTEAIRVNPSPDDSGQR